jgi:predicted Zn-dependent protease
MRLLLVAPLLIAVNLPAQVPASAREQALGRVMATEIEKRERVVEDPEVVEYVSGITQKLVKACGRGSITVRVIQSDEVNGSVIPGGFLFVNLGLLRAVDNEAELAGVLAHLMTRTPVTAAASAQPFIGGKNGDSFAPAEEVPAPRGLESALLAAVSAADQRAMQCIDKAGYDPVGLINFLRRLPAIPVERMEHVAEVIQALEPSSAYLMTTRQFAEVRQHVTAAKPARARTPVRN